MDDLKHIVKLLEAQDSKISKIIEILESQTGKNLGQAKITPLASMSNSQTPSIMKNKNKPKYPIGNLYQNHFFKTGKSLSDVSKKLADDGFHFKLGSIQFALDSVDYLDRVGHQGSYRWIQKYPPG